MKKLLFTTLICVAYVTAFAQGRVSFSNNSLRLIYYDPTRVVDDTLAGNAVYGGNMPAGITLLGDLYIGTSSSSLSLISSTTVSPTIPGVFSTLSVQVPGIPGGTSVFVVAQVRDSASTPEATWTPNFDPNGKLNWYGVSQEFTFVLGTSTIAYPAMWSTGGTWAAGTFPMDQYGAGFRGAIGVAPVPEPGTFALAALAAAAMLIFRCRR